MPRSGPSWPPAWIASPSAASMPRFATAPRAGYRESGGSSRSRSRRRTPRSSSPWTTGGGRAAFYLRTGSASSGRARSPCSSSARPPRLPAQSGPPRRAQPPVLRIQPDEACRCHSAPAARTGAAHQVRGDGLRLRKRSAARPPRPTSACCSTHEGRATLYARGDWVDLAWELLSPVLDRWATADASSRPTSGTLGLRSGHPLERAAAAGATSS